MKRRKRRLSVRTHGNYAGVPRVVNDCELYTVLAQMTAAKEPERQLSEYVRLWCTPYEDWQLAVFISRARVFLAFLRKEAGRRGQLDPNQLRLKGL